MNTTKNHDTLTSTRGDRWRTRALAASAVVPCALAALWFAAPNLCQNALRSRDVASEERAPKANATKPDDAQNAPKDDWRSKLDALYPDENFVERLDFPAPPAPNLDDDYDLAAKMEEFEPSEDFSSLDGDFAQDPLPQAPLAEQIALRDEYAPDFTTSVLDDAPLESFETELAQDDVAPTSENVEPDVSPFAPVSEEDVFGDLFASNSEPNVEPTPAVDAEIADVPLVAEAPLDSPLANDILPPQSDDLDELPPAPNQFALNDQETPTEGYYDPILGESNVPQDLPAPGDLPEPSPEVDSIAAQPPLPSAGLSSSAYLDATPEPVEPPVQTTPSEPVDVAHNVAQDAPQDVEPEEETASLTAAERDVARRIAAYDRVAATEPSYFSRALDLYGGENAFSQLNFARAARIIDESAAFNPRAISSAFDRAANAPEDAAAPPELAFNPEPVAPAATPEPVAEPAPAPVSNEATTPNAEPAPASAPAEVEPTYEGAQVARPNKVALVGYEEKATPPRASGVGYIAKSPERRDAHPLAALEGELGALGLVGARVERWDAERWRASGARQRGADGGLEFRQGFGATPREATDALKNDLANQ